MKTGIFSLVVFALLQVALTQPHGLPLKHRHHRRQAGDVNVVTEEVEIWVDQDNNPVSTSTIYRYPVAPTPTPAPVDPAPVVAVEPVAKGLIAAPEQSAPVTTSSPTPAAPASTSKPAAAPPASSTAPASTPESKPEVKNQGTSSSSGSGIGMGISYSPYKTNNECKSPEEVKTDLQGISGYDTIRLYGVDCDQITKVSAALQSSGKNTKLFLGIFSLENAQAETQTLITAINGNWGLVSAINVGNELVNQFIGSHPGDEGAISAYVGKVTGAVNQARSQLRSAGYTGPVVTVDTMVAMKKHIELCTASDFCAINCHAFFDGGVNHDGAGPFVLDWAQQISAAAGGKLTVVTESGWPSRGDPKNKAVPSPSNQAAAVSSLKSSFGQNIIIYSAYNNLWMQDHEGTYNAEKFWGINGNSHS